jgi:bis(5'-adenosyl)-triphosphatase
MRSIKRVGNVVQKAYGGDALTIACQVLLFFLFVGFNLLMSCQTQDGKAAGQSVPHVHFHLLPRKFQGDPFAGKNDEIYPELEKNEVSIPDHLPNALSSISSGSQHQHLRVDADEDRVPRTLQEMEEEAKYLKGFFSERT